MKPESNNELDWVAYNYVAGEMSAEESNQFEVRLATDQAAREAVAASVALLQAISLAGRDVTVASPRRNTLAWPIGVATAIAAGVVCILALPPMLRVAPPSGSPPSEAMVLAQAWTDVRENADLFAGNLDGLVALDDVEVDWDLLVDEAEDAARPLPAWLLTATATRSPERIPQ